MPVSKSSAVFFRPPVALRCLLFLAAIYTPLAQALEPVTLQLKWTHAFQFAGYYAAEEKGYYREAGLEVHIEEARPDSDPVKAVVDGRAQFGVGMSNLLLVRQAGQPVVVLAVIFQHSPLVIAARQEKPEQTVHDLVGKRVMIEHHSDELFAYLKQEGIPVDRLQQVPHSFDPDDLIKGRVDAMSAYSTNESYLLDQAHLRYQTYSPRAAGIDFYGDNLFTVERELKQNPQRVEAFRAASLKGWQYAMAHPDEIAELIYRKYSRAHPVAFYRFEASRMVPLMRTDLIDVGYMTPGRWMHIASTYADLGLLPRNFSLSGFLYAPHPERDLGWLLPVMGLFLLGSLIGLYIVLINRRLRAALSHSLNSETDLRRREQQYRMLAENMADVVWALDPEAWRFTYISPSVERLRGYPVEEVMAQPFDHALMPSERERARHAIHERVADVKAGRAGPETIFVDEVEQPRKDGGSVWTEVVTRYLLDEATGQVEVHGVSRDIGERKQNQERVRFMAQHDALTGLANRALFSDLLDQALANARRDKTLLALLFLDLDHFKPVNDLLGHGIGDQLLQAVAQRILANVRESDTVARIGGDEFVVLLRKVDGAASAEAVARKVCACLSPAYEIGGHHLEISASVGVAMYPAHGSDAVELTKHADDAMYEAKRAGRNRAVIYGDDE